MAWLVRKNIGRTAEMDLKDHVRTIPDFPKPGILFYDISTLLRDAKAWQSAVNQLSERIAVYKPEMLLGIEARGFLFAAPILRLTFLFTRFFRNSADLKKTSA